MMANGTPAAQPQAAQGQPAPTASPKEANKTLILAGISIGLIVIVVLGLFLSQQFVGKAIQPGALDVGIAGLTAPYTDIGQPSVTIETLQPQQAFYVDFYANLGEEKSLVGEATIQYEPDALNPAEGGAVIVNAEKNIMLLNDPTIDAGQGLITFQFAVRPPEGFAGTIDDLVLSGEVKLATLHFVVDDDAAEAGSEISVFSVKLLDEEGEEIAQAAGEATKATFDIELPEETCGEDVDCSNGEFCENQVCQTASCTDSDAEEDDPLAVKGTVTIDYSIGEDSTQEDVCTEDGQLSERSCSDSREIATETASCGEGKECREGACSDIPPPDADADGVEDENDNCLNAANADQANADDDELGNACDNCPNVPNQDQANEDADELGDECDVPPDAPSVIITRPANGARVQAPFTVQFTINNWDVNIGTSHYHVFVDDAGTPIYTYNTDEGTAKKASYTIDELADGQHTITIKLAEANHAFPEGEAVEDSITITVGPPLKPEKEDEDAEGEAEGGEEEGDTGVDAEDGTSSEGAADGVDAGAGGEEGADEKEVPADEVDAGAGGEEGANEEEVPVEEPALESELEEEQASIITVSVEELPVVDNTFTTKISATKGFSGKEITIYTVLYDADGKVLALKREKLSQGMAAGESYVSTLSVQDATLVKKKVVLVHDVPPDAGQTVQGSLTTEY